MSELLKTDGGPTAKGGDLHGDQIDEDSKENDSDGSGSYEESSSGGEDDDESGSSGEGDSDSVPSDGISEGESEVGKDARVSRGRVDDEDDERTRSRVNSLGKNDGLNALAMAKQGALGDKQLKARERL